MYCPSLKFSALKYSETENQERYKRRSRRESTTLEERAQEEREQEKENDVTKPSGRDKSLCIPNLRNMLYQVPLYGRVLATYY